MRKKSCILFGLIAMILVSSSVGEEKASFAEGHRPGDMAPKIKPEGSREAVDFANQTGRYTLVNFWATYDAVSRIRNMQLGRKAGELDSTRLLLCSVSLDEKAVIFAETLKTDGLDTSGQWFAGKERSTLIRKYRLKNRFTNFLVDDRGVIVATGLSVQQLSKFKIQD
ncbi:MAG: thioredoxin family protein [Tannerella sp.]|nr:thioredoxin family protein [Tannerella sp.]